MSGSRASAKVRVGVIGCGYWGPNLIRNFARNDRSSVTAVCDSQLERAEKVGNWYGVPLVTADPADVIGSPDVDLVVVATPSRTHFALASQAILAGKHVLVMKPMTTSVAQAEELVDLAARQGVILAVDHTFVYSGAVRKIRELVATGDLGDVFYVDSVRINLGIFQSDVNVIWDLAAHDVSIIDFVLGGRLPTDVSAVGAAHAGSWAHNIAYLTMRYEPNILAHVHVNWLAPAKIRRTIVGGSRQMVVYDDTQPAEKVMVYDRGVSIAPWSNPEDVYGHLVSYRSGDMWAPRLDDREALAVEADHLLDCILAGRQPITDGAAGLRTVRILEAADLSARNGQQRSPAYSDGNGGQLHLVPAPIDGATAELRPDVPERVVAD
jgi:predicted dehydrogenase